MARVSHGLTAVAAVLLTGCLGTSVSVWQPAELDQQPFNDTVCTNSHIPVGPSDADMVRQDQEIELLVTAGIGCIRFDVLWREIEPQKGQFEFAAYDTVVEKLSRAGLDILALVTYATPWATVDESDSSIAPEDFGRFAGAVADRYAGTISYYEVWNEPNWVFWRPEPDPDVYGALFLQAATDIRAADPEAQVVIGGTFSIPGMLEDRLWGFLYDTADAHPQIGRAMDILSYHPYTQFQQAAPETGKDSDVQPSLVRMTNQIRAFADAVGGPQRLWNTEAGWSSDLVGERDQALYRVRALLISAWLGVERFHMFNAVDGDPDKGVPLEAERHYGMVYYDVDPTDGQTNLPKPAYTAVSRLLNLARGTAVVRDPGFSDIPDDDGSFLVSLAAPGRLVQIAWHSDPGSDERRELQPPAGWTFDHAVRVLDGTDVPRPPDDVYAIGEDPLAVTFVIAD